MHEHRVHMSDVPTDVLMEVLGDYIEVPCRFYWGTHGCCIDGNRPHTIHFCGDPTDTCCEFNEETNEVRFYDDATRAYDMWQPYASTPWRADEQGRRIP